MRPRSCGVVAALAIALLAAGCTAKQPQPPAPAPNGPSGAAIAYGRELIVNTRKHLKPYVTADMDCAACHLNAGLQQRGGSFAGIAAQFPQWNKRAGRVISLQDRLAECFLYSMNGRPPAYNSREMEAMVAYITYLSRGTAIGSKADPAAVLASITLPKADPQHGAQLYAQKCAACHGASGSGSAVYPPLWGPASFNDGAGMHRLRTMAGFVRYNMPQNAPGTLNDQQSYDVAAFVLSHKRPVFDRSRLIGFPARRASYF